MLLKPNTFSFHKLIENMPEKITNIKELSAIYLLFFTNRSIINTIRADIDNIRGDSIVLIAIFTP
jgi:hypothetical protein